MAGSEKIEYEQMQSDAVPIVEEERPFIYIDGFAGIIETNGVIRLRLVRSRLSSTGQPVQEVPAHLAMSVPTLLSFHKTLGQVIEGMRKDGKLPPAEDVPVGG